jgi:hypothetical protein
MHDKIVEAIRELIKSRDDEDMLLCEQIVWNLVYLHEEQLVPIILDKEELINVRAMAARLLFAKSISIRARIPELGLLLDALSQHGSPLIRLGVVLGLGDAWDFKRVSVFLKDLHPKVVEEAQDILDEAEEEGHYIRPENDD